MRMMRMAPPMADARLVDAIAKSASAIVWTLGLLDADLAIACPKAGR